MLIPTDASPIASVSSARCLTLVLVLILMHRNYSEKSENYTLVLQSQTH